MKISFGNLFLGLSTSILILLFCFGYFFVDSTYLSRIQRQYRESNSTFTELIGKTIRPAVLQGDYMLVRRVFQSAIKNQDFTKINLSYFDFIGEPVCVSNDNSCYSESVDLISNREVIREKIFFDEDETRPVAEVQVTLSNEGFLKTIDHLRSRLVLALIGSFILINGVFLLGIRRVKWRLQGYLKRLKGILVRSDTSTRSERPFLQIEEVEEFNSLANQLRSELDDYRREFASRLEQEKREEIAKLVAHDIRSPLSALEMVSKDLTQLPEPLRVLIRKSIDRIREISNNLLRPSASEGAEIGIEHILGILEESVAEKRAQLEGVDISLLLQGATHELFNVFARINRVEFQRIISNLLNNAWESKKGRDRSKIEVILRRESGWALVSVVDNGKGMPEEIQKSVFEKGFTYGKSAGSGLGLYHAKLKTEQYGGSIILQSQVGVGTSVTLKYPICQVPSWHLEMLRLSSQHSMIILDNEPFVFPLWAKRVEDLDVALAPAKVVELKSEEELVEWMRGEGIDRRQCVFLVDFELEKGKKTGLEIITDFGLQQYGIIVTNMVLDSNLRRECSKFGIKLLSKAMIKYLPIGLAKSSVPSS